MLRLRENIFFKKNLKIFKVFLLKIWWLFLVHSRFIEWFKKKNFLIVVAFNNQMAS